MFKGFEKNKRSLEESDFILCTGFFEDKEDSLDFYKDLLKKNIQCKKHKKLLSIYIGNYALFERHLLRLFAISRIRMKYSLGPFWMAAPSGSSTPVFALVPSTTVDTSFGLN